jgi:hypothetical protein
MGKFNENSKLKDILKDEKAKAIIEKYLPGMLNNPGLRMALIINPTVKQAIPYHKQIGMTEETMNNFMNELYSLE